MTLTTRGARLDARGREAKKTMSDPAWRIRDTAVFRELDGEGVVLDVASGTYFGLNGVGTLIWQLVEAHGRASDVASGVTRRYDVSPDRARADVLALMATLVARGLAECVHDDV
jgi:hypothetical protein